MFQNLELEKPDHKDSSESRNVVSQEHTIDEETAEENIGLVCISHVQLRIHTPCLGFPVSVETGLFASIPEVSVY